MEGSLEYNERVLSVDKVRKRRLACVPHDSCSLFPHYLLQGVLDVIIVDSASLLTLDFR